MNKMEQYEVPVLMKPLLPDDIKDKVTVNIEKLAKDLGGKLKTKQVWGKKHLAYPIKNHQEGYYVFFGLEIAPGKLKDFRTGMGLMNDVLRFMILREDEL